MAVSKLFPAGFGWQYSSGIAEDTFGLEANDYGFFLVTGLGDFCGVFAGHFSYYLGKKILYDRSIVVGEQAHVALWLAAAAFASGGMWQPFVNFFQACSGEGNHFNTHLMATMVGCGTMFYTGLRVGRYFLSPVLTGIPACDYNNLRADAQLSVAIGGATACFVGTDVSYGDGNWLRPLVGVEDSFGTIHGCVLAGTSTALGFTTVQIAENIVRAASTTEARPAVLELGPTPPHVPPPLFPPPRSLTIHTACWSICVRARSSGLPDGHMLGGLIAAAVGVGCSVCSLRCKSITIWGVYNSSNRGFPFLIRLLFHAHGV